MAGPLMGLFIRCQLVYKIMKGIVESSIAEVARFVFFKFIVTSVYMLWRTTIMLFAYKLTDASDYATDACLIKRSGEKFTDNVKQQCKIMLNTIFLYNKFKV